MAHASESLDPGKMIRRERLFQRINKAATWLNILGLGWVAPLLRIAAGDNLAEQMSELRKTLLIPLTGILLFLVAWGVLAPTVKTSLGAVPGPVEVFQQAGGLWQDHLAEREKAAAFYER